MRRKNPISSIVFAVLISTTSAIGAEEANAVKAVEAPSLLERTTTTVQDLLLKSLEMVGVRYKWGGTDPDAGLDCSGFVQRVFQDSLGLFLPRTAKEMSAVGEKIRPAELLPGDLVFFNTMRRTFSHVGIYLGDFKFMHAPRAGSEVRIEDLRQGYWTKRYNGARRVLGNR